MVIERLGNQPVVAVCGSSALPDVELEELAEQVGAELFGAGMNIVSGGLDGVMAAVSRGAAQAREVGGGDGIIIGILPGTQKEEANPYCDIVIPTGLGMARNALVVHAADAVILIHGGSGTLSEAAFAWQVGKPVVALVTSGGWAGKLGGQRLDGRRDDTVLSARTASEAVALIRDELEARR